MSLVAGTRLGPYEVLAAIGTGGMGEVYRARDTRLGRDVAIKILPADMAADAERLRRFEREAQATAALSHPNILDVHDVGTVGRTPYLVEELLEGESLRDRLARTGVPVREAVDIAVQVAHGLAAAHGKYIVHRDLKPANVFLTTDGTVKILDFGIAKLAERGPFGEADTLTHAPTGATEVGHVMGTVAYMSPEQARGLPVDPRSDIFSFGVLLYEMLSGKPPFRGETATDTVAAILKEEPRALPAGVPPALQRVVSQCLEKRPEHRFSSAHDLALALQAASSPGEVAPVSVMAVAVRASPRRRRLGGGVLVCVAVLTGLAIWRPWRGVSTPAGSGPAHVPSILALPCKVYGAPDVAFLADAVPGSISTLLAQVDGLDTKVPPSSVEVEKVKGDYARLAELYQVPSFIVSSLTTSPGRFALDVQIVDAATRRLLWAQQYEGPRDAYNDLVRQAAEGIRQAVKPTASPVLTARVSSQVELAYREGEYYHTRYLGLFQRPDFDAALAAYTRALALDPTFAAAAGKVADLYTAKFTDKGDAQNLQTAEKLAHDALRIDPRSGEAWEALSAAELFSIHADPAKGIDYATRAVAFAPRDARAHSILGMWGLGSNALFTAAMRHASELDPLLLGPAANAAVGLCDLGRPGEALAVVDRALRVEPGFPWGLGVRGYVLLRLGRLDEAAAALQRSEASATATHTVGALWRYVRFALAVAQRDTPMSETLARQVLAQVFDPKADANLVSDAPGFAVPALIRMGRTDDAMRVLVRSVEAGVAPPYDWLLSDPDIQRLHGDPRFGGVLAGARRTAALAAEILAQAHARGELPAYLEPPLDELAQLLKKNEDRH